MPIPVQCEKCQTPYSVPDSLAGKRAKCKACGAVLSIPEVLESPELIPIEAGEGLSPLAGAGEVDVFGVSSAQVFSAPAAVSPLRTRPSSNGNVLSLVIPTLLTFGLSAVGFFGFFCLGWAPIGLLIGCVGLMTSICALIASLNQSAKWAWVSFSVLAISNVLGGVSILVLYAVVSRVALAAKAPENIKAGNAPVVAPVVSTTSSSKYQWPMATDPPPWKKPAAGSATASNNSPTTPTTPHEDDTRLPRGPRKLAEAKIKLTDWHIQPDPAPESLLIGTGRELTISLPEHIRSNQVYLPEGYGSAVAIVDSYRRECEVWDLKNRRRLNRFKHGEVTQQGAISPDGLHVAALRLVEKDKWALMFWSTLTGQSTADVALNFDGVRAVSRVGFAGPNVAYLAYTTHKDEKDFAGTAQITLWEPSTGASLGTLPAVKENLQNAYLLPSPGGRYLALCGSQITFWDMKTTEIAGQFELPKRWRCDGLSFPPAGDRMAMLLIDDEDESHFGVWSLDTQQFTLARDNPKRAVGESHGWFRNGEIAWLDDNQGWISRFRQLDPATGEVTAQFGRAIAREQTRKIFDANQLLTGESLGSFKTLRLDKFDPLRLKPVRIGSSEPFSSRDGFDDSSEDDRHRNAGAVPFPYEELLAADPATWKQHWQYCAGLGRPTVGLRWGIGVNQDVSARNAQNVLEPQMAARDSLRWLEGEAGPIGIQVVQALRKRGQAGQWGKFVDLQDTRLREVIVLGGGTRTQLANSARLGSVDIAAIIKIEAKGKDKDATLTVEIVDMASTNKLWESKPLLASKVAQMQGQGIDPLGETVAEVGKFIDEKLALTALSTMPRTEIATRAETSPLHRSNQMAGLAELMLYDHHKAVSKDVILAAYTKLAGKPADAAILAGDDAAARKALVEKYASEW